MTDHVPMVGSSCHTLPRRQCVAGAPERPASSAGRPRDDVSSPSDADVAMERYSSGDDAAFGAVYDAVAPQLHAYLLRRTRSSARADDLLQQTMLHIHRARACFIPGARVMPWAFTIARRLFVDALRRERREVPYGVDGSEPEERAAPGASADDIVQVREVVTRIDRVLAGLPSSQREAFELIKYRGLSLADAACTLGTTVAAVKQRVHRAYEAVCFALGDATGAASGVGY